MTTGKLQEKGRPMKTIFESCTPRPEVLASELREQQFAASLTKVLRGELMEWRRMAACGGPGPLLAVIDT